MADKEKLDCPIPGCGKKYTAKGLDLHLINAHRDSLSFNGADQAAEIASLKEENEKLKGELETKLAEVPIEETDQERFADLVDGVRSLTTDGKARLAEEVTGWTYQGPEPAPIIAEPTPEVAIVDPEPVKRRRIIIIPKK